MRPLTPPDPYVDAKLFGIMLSGVFGQTRADCGAESPARRELRPSGIQRIVLPAPPDRKPKA